MPPLAVIKSPARIVVVDAMLFADIAADALMVAVVMAVVVTAVAEIVADILAFPRISRATVGDELPMPILALPPPTKYKLFAALAFVPYWTIGAVAVVVRTLILLEASRVVVEMLPFATNVFPVGIDKPLLAVIKPDAVKVVAEMPPLAVSRLPAETMRPCVAFIISVAFIKVV